MNTQLGAIGVRGRRMLLWQFCLFMLLVTKVEGKAVNENKNVSKAMRTAGGGKAPNASQQNTPCNNVCVMNSNGKLKSAPERRHFLTNSNNSSPRMNGSDVVSVVVEMAWQTLAEHVPRCHFVLLTSDTQNPIVSQIIRLSAIKYQSLVVVDLKRLQQETSDYLLMALWGGTTTTCRVLFIDLTTDDLTALFRFVETSRLWLYSEAWVVIIGSKLHAHVALQHEALRNVFQPIFLALQNATLQGLTNQNVPLKQKTWQNDQKLVESIPVAEKKDSSDVVTVLSRCLYCNEGEPHVRFLFFWPLGSKLADDFSPFPDQLSDLQGHQINIVSITFFPYMDYQLDTDEPATTVTLLDSLDKRLIETFSAHMNFTYEVRAPWDMKFGLLKEDGNWTGMIGTIQYNKADFCTYFAPNAQRLAIISPVRAYDTDVFAIVSLKPEVLPRYLVIIRPFTVEVWLYLLLVIMIWGATLWLLQKGWSRFSGGKPGMSLYTAIFYSWAVILEDPPLNPPTNTTGQVLVGWWLMACLVISTGYKSSLITNLVKESMASPINSMQEMVARDGWQWMAEKKHLTGYPLQYFLSTKDPLVKHIYNNMEFVDDNDAGLKKVLKGGHSYFAERKLISTIIASYHTDSVGETPYYISKYGLALFPDFCWGFRRGAPFRDRIDLLMIRLQEAGITNYWTQDIMAIRVRKNRREAQQKDSEQKIQVYQKSDDQVVLRMTHLTGVFFVILLGFGVSILSFLAEWTMHKCKSG